MDRKRASTRSRRSERALAAIAEREEKARAAKGKYAFKKRRYKGKMDAEVVSLCDALNACPGIITFESCCGHGKDPFSIYFYATDPVGLFFVTRCADRRYWKHGHRWTIHLSVGDDTARADGRTHRRMGIDPAKPDDILPTTYVLESLAWWGKELEVTCGEKAYRQAQDLVRNMILHLTSGFMEFYDLDIGRFGVKEVTER
jgi:hypothetical protein